MSQPITVIKRDINGQETWRYSGQVLQKTDKQVILQAFFERDDRLIHGMPFCKGDRFVETYFFERWYNIFEIHSREDDSLRGWYCNIGHPARQDDAATISYIDLALDLLVFPNGKQLVLDEDEFELLPLQEIERSQALEALAALQARFRNLKSY